MSTSSEKMEGVEEEKTNNYHMDKDENVLALSGKSFPLAPSIQAIKLTKGALYQKPS